jgi:MFS family permease
VRARVVRGDGLLVLVVCGFASLVATQAGRVMSSDGWLSLVAGRLIAHHGLPSRNGLTVLGHGHRWVDQQWLAQVLLYGVERVGGIPLLVALHAVLVVAAFAAAVVAARVRGARPPSIALIAVIAILPFFATASVVRPQSFVYILFVALVVMLSSRRELSGRRITVVFVLLVVWANLHGSVLLAAGIVALRGLAELREHGWRPRSLLLVVAPWVYLFVSPYASGLPHYYAVTAFNPTFGRYLAQWGPTGLSAVSAPVFLLALGIIWLLGRVPDAYSRFERALLVVVVVVALLAVRNWPWLVLAAVILMPRGIDAVRRRDSAREPSARLDAVVALVGVALVVLATATGFSKLDRLERERYPPAAADAVAAAARARPQATVFASVQFGDWLLWRHPELAGRLLWDARYELLTSKEIERNALFRFGASTDVTLARSEIFLLDPSTDRRAIAAIGARVRPTFRAHRVYVAVER